MPSRPMPTKTLSQAMLLKRAARQAARRKVPSTESVLKKVLLARKKTSAIVVQKFYKPMLSNNISGYSTEHFQKMAQQIRNDRTLVEKDKKAMLSLLCKNSGRKQSCLKVE